MACLKCELSNCGMRRSVITLCLESATRTIVNRQQAPHAGRRRVRRRHLPGRSGPPRGVPDRERGSRPGGRAARLSARRHGAAAGRPGFVSHPRRRPAPTCPSWWRGASKTRPCPPCCCMDTATWCATRRAGTPAAIPGRCARATAGRARHRRQQGPAASTWPRCQAIAARRQAGLQRRLADRDRRGSRLARPGRLLRGPAR